MPIAVQCPGCGGKFRAPDELLGKKVKCPTCPAIIEVGSRQGQEPASRSPKHTAPHDATQSIADDHEATRGRTRARQSVLMWTCVAGGGIALLLFAAVFWSLSTHKSTTPTDALSTPADTGPSVAANERQNVVPASPEMVAAAEAKRKLPTKRTDVPNAGASPTEGNEAPRSGRDGDKMETAAATIQQDKFILELVPFAVSLQDLVLWRLDNPTREDFTGLDEKVRKLEGALAAATQPPPGSNMCDHLWGLARRITKDQRFYYSYHKNLPTAKELLQAGKWAEILKWDLSDEASARKIEEVQSRLYSSPVRFVKLYRTEFLKAIERARATGIVTQEQYANTLAALNTRRPLATEGNETPADANHEGEVLDSIRLLTYGDESLETFLGAALGIANTRHLTTTLMGSTFDVSGKPTPIREIFCGFTWTPENLGGGDTVRIMVPFYQNAKITAILGERRVWTTEQPSGTDVASPEIPIEKSTSMNRAVGLSVVVEPIPPNNQCGVTDILVLAGKRTNTWPDEAEGSASNDATVKKPGPVEPGRETPPQKARGDTATNTVVLTGKLFDKHQTPVKGETVYLFGWSDEQAASLISIDEGRVSNPRGVSDATGRFTIVVKADFLKKHKKFVFGFLSEPSLSTWLLRRGGFVNTFSIDASNYGKTVDLGTVTE